MDPIGLAAFEDEITKIAGLRELWRRVTDFFRPKEERVQRKVDYFFSPRAGADKWTKLLTQVKDPTFVDAFVRNPLADDKLRMHVQSMHSLAKGKPVSKIKSKSLPGKTYEVRELSGGGLGCQCNDWKFRGSVNPGYECKHIKEYKSLVS